MANCDGIAPSGDKIKKALKWLSEAVQNEPEKSRLQLLEQAEIRFNLSPRECEFLNANFGELPKKE